GGGGSGFVYTSSSAGNVPSGYLLPSTMQLTNTILRGGNESFPAVTSGNETGHKGNGYVKITLLE
ncbi:MAG: hypothetical protein IJU23_04575, partial [Proteobacteria bacterium]|nr:hypothetical protein [Pseudomonadota bacterium]